MQTIYTYFIKNAIQTTSSLTPLLAKEKGNGEWLIILII
jgi:hypothetical protein